MRPEYIYLNDRCSYESGKKHKHRCYRIVTGQAMERPAIAYGEDRMWSPVPGASRNRDHGYQPHEICLEYTHAEPFGEAEVAYIFRADSHAMLASGGVCRIKDLKAGAELLLEGGGICTVRAVHPCERRPLPAGEWTGLQPRRVIGTVKHLAYTVMDLTWGEATVTTSPNHLFWSATRGEWIPAEKLYPGEMLRTADGSTMPVEAVGKPRGGFVLVYNVEVAEFHTYFVGRGDRAVLVHNGWDCIKKPIIDDALESGGVNGTTAYRAGATRPPRHHVFPQQYEDWFKARGVDIDRYTLPLDEGTHGALHYGGGPGKGGGFWNEEIMKMLMDREAALGRQLTPREILAIGAQMRRQFLPGVKIISYNSP